MQRSVVLLRLICFSLCSVFMIFLSLLSAQAEDRVRVTHWDILPEKSFISFTATQSGKPFEGKLPHFNGRISFDPALLDYSYVEIVIDMVSIEAGHRDRNKYIHYPEWLATQDFPQAVFKSSKFSESKPNHFIAHGSLTIRDMTLPVDLPFSLVFEEGAAGKRAVYMQGTTSLSRLDYGIGQGVWNDTKTVGEGVEVKVFLEALAQ